ncbi:MAG: hypothetical protein M3295_09500, partial [Chloroflexota bacterium]|nr:hypothetical protein [Chloroflexota bacterium]
HEVRSGELATLGKVPHGRYYGSVDATPLFVSLFVDACRWIGWLPEPSAAESPAAARRRAPRDAMPSVLARLLPAAEAALHWIDAFGSGDGGLVWYRPRNPRAGRNHVWKDSNDSYRYADGTLARPPIAAVEVQGYVCEAKRGMADVYEALGRRDAAAELRAQAEQLASTVDEMFWMPAESTYAMGIDRRGRQIDSVTSNPGHLLWSGAARPARAARLVDRLLAEDMFSGWGVRSMSSRMAAFNPLSYHNGSVWPHDNSLIAAGMARYGHARHAWRVIDALLDAATVARPARLPELFAGFARDRTRDLVPYPSACAPQAWASGAIALAVETALRLDAARGTPVGVVENAPALRLSGAGIGGWSGSGRNVAEAESRTRRRGTLRRSR